MVWRFRLWTTTTRKHFFGERVIYFSAGDVEIYAYDEDKGYIRSFLSDYEGSNKVIGLECPLVKKTAVPSFKCANGTTNAVLEEYWIQRVVCWFMHGAHHVFQCYHDESEGGQMEGKMADDKVLFLPCPLSDSQFEAYCKTLLNEINCAITFSVPYVNMRPKLGKYLVSIVQKICREYIGQLLKINWCSLRFGLYFDGNGKARAAKEAMDAEDDYKTLFELIMFLLHNHYNTNYSSSRKRRKTSDTESCSPNVCDTESCSPNVCEIWNIEDFKCLETMARDKMKELESDSDFETAIEKSKEKCDAETQNKKKGGGKKQK